MSDPTSTPVGGVDPARDEARKAEGAIEDTPAEEETTNEPAPEVSSAPAPAAENTSETPTDAQ